jgi:hypothetical protein
LKKRLIILFSTFFILLIGCTTHTETKSVTITPQPITSAVTSIVTITPPTVTSTVISETHPEAIKYGIDDSGHAWYESKMLIGGRDQIPVFNKNPNAKPVSYEELKQFLSSTRQSRSDLLADGKHDCSDFAAELYNEAERAGIESGIVILFSNNDYPNHGINCFKTLDTGKVYIDSIWYNDNEKNPQLGEYYIVGDDGVNPDRILLVGIYEIW